MNNISGGSTLDTTGNTYTEPDMVDCSWLTQVEANPGLIRLDPELAKDENLGAFTEAFKQEYVPIRVRLGQQVTETQMKVRVLYLGR